MASRTSAPSTPPPRIETTTVGSYPVPEWLTALPGEQALVDATRVVFDVQRQAGIDLPTDGELYRFDADHPDTNGMIEYFVRRLGGISSAVGRREAVAFRAKSEMRFRSRPAGVVVAPIDEGTLNLPDDCSRAASVAGGAFKFTLTSPYMLARTLLDEHYRDLPQLTLAIADALAAQAASLDCSCVQVDEANIPGNPADAPLAAEAINRVLDAVTVTKAVHFCFGNYGGQTIQRGTWTALIDFLNNLHADHLIWSSNSRTVRPATSTRCAICAKTSASASASWTSRSTTSRPPTRSPPQSNARSERSARGACNTFTRIAASGC
jgi:5-methyltetrahydropteroyltriglutamate--homocysteine methyltransferase